MNQFDDKELDQNSFAWRDIQGQDKWTPFDPAFGALTIVGTPAYFGRYRRIGRQVQFQVRFSAGTSIASVAGTDYLRLPIAAQGLSGGATMQNLTTNVAVGVCVLDITNSRCYLPSQVASGNTFALYGEYEA